MTRKPTGQSVCSGCGNRRKIYNKSLDLCHACNIDRLKKDRAVKPEILAPTVADFDKIIKPPYKIKLGDQEMAIQIDSKKTEEKYECGKCHTEFSEKKNFCPNCGIEFDWT